MVLIVGLGNPGRKFQKTRHNLGFRIIDELAKKNKFPVFKLSKKINSLISKGKLNKKEIIVLKPQTFMNESGKAVKKLTYNLQLITYNLWVVHDDIDLPLGKMRIVENRGAAGHKGVQSIIDELGTKNFIRFRVGIKPKTCNLKPKTLEKFVLQKFNKKEETTLKEVIKITCQVIELTIKKGVEIAMQEFNR